jgi:hypothetical protein
VVGLSILEAGHGLNGGLRTMIFAGLMGKTFGRIARLFRWRPVGKQVRITVVESIDGSLLGQTLTGVITKVALIKELISSMEECPVIQLDSPVHYMGHRLDTILAIPRHTGYGLYSLPFTGIAVYIISINDSEEPVVAKWEDIIAIWWLSLSRFNNKRA